jgi:hypothetical protein
MRVFGGHRAFAPLATIVVLIGCGGGSTSPSPGGGPSTRLLSVTLSTPNAGVVSSVPGGIDCGNDCTESYAIGTDVVLTLGTVASDYSFDGWGGACASAGMNISCTVSMSENRNVVAGFRHNNPSGVILYQQDFEDWNTYNTFSHLTEGARIEHATGWNGGGAAKISLGTHAVNHYAGWQYFSVPESLWQNDKLHVRWCTQLGSELLPATRGENDKMLIIHRADVVEPPNPRIIAILHRYQNDARQIFSSNNVDNSPPSPPLYTLEDKIGQWMCFEIGLSLLDNSRQFWATVQGGAEIRLQNEPLNSTDGRWTGNVEFGYWGEATASAEAWWKLDELVISNTKIGPPPGFAQ